MTFVKLTAATDVFCRNSQNNQKINLSESLWTSASTLCLGLASMKGLLFLINSLWEAAQSLYIETRAVLNRTANLNDILGKTKSNDLS